MTDKSFKEWASMSDKALAEYIGAFVRHQSFYSELDGKRRNGYSQHAITGIAGFRSITGTVRI
ncbi:MAG: hypothetical protein PF450_00885 [Bacteroidales bacterium]|jgi:hypothetical protein|nr:hypothetical protein [Bacteroidales bacterium]